MEQRLATKKIFLFIECFADKKGFAQTKGFPLASFKKQKGETRTEISAHTSHNRSILFDVRKVTKTPLFARFFPR